MTISKPMPGYEGLYQIDDERTVRSNARPTTPGGVLKQTRDKFGYMYVSLCKNGIAKKYKTHQLVLFSFIGKLNLDCNHKNGIKSDNRLSNLEYCTRSENLKHAFKIGLKNNKGKNSSRYRSGLEESDIEIIRKLKGIVKQKTLAYLFDISRSYVCGIQRKTTWRHI